ncbi:MAG TPA: flagellar hook-associated protein FlgK [Symbiobacteriaceae bacterium]|nr:flagellar hook-associated protein FlgK [Symbiobacteriaceae bacterium]
MGNSLFAGFNSAVRSMQYAQHAMNVHSTNVAHANDTNYTRQVAASPSESRLDGPGIIRSRDAFVDDQYRLATGSLGEAEVRHKTLTKVEDIFGDPVEGGLRKAIDQFFDAWQGLAENPADGVARLQVLSGGQILGQQIKETYDKLTAVETTVNEELATRVNEVNTALNQVFDLNKRIAGMQRNNMDDAALRDERDVLLDKLAHLVGATAIPNTDGTVRVVTGSVVLVDGPTVAKLKLQPISDGGGAVWEAYGSPPFVGRGAVAGLLSVRDGELTQLKNDIATMAEALRTAVNAQHRAGYPIGGRTGDLVDFFVTTGAPADLAVNPALTPEQLHAAGGMAGSPADGDNARRLAQLADRPVLASVIMPGEQQAFRAYYRNLVGWVGNRGNETAQAEEIARVHQRVNEQQRQAGWGVSTDEEVAGLTMQQKAFAAAARVITVMDEMMDTLINRTGV